MPNVVWFYIFKIWKKKSSHVNHTTLATKWLRTQNFIRYKFLVKGCSFLYQCFAQLRFWKSVSSKTAVAPASRFCESETLFQNRSCAKHWFKKLKPLVKSSKPSISQPFYFLYSEKKNHLIDTDNILYVKSIGDYVKIVTINGVIVVYSTIKSFYTRLPFFFFRQHRSYIVNIRKIKTVSISRLELLDKSIIPLTRGRKHQILRLISSLEEVC